MSTDLRIDQGQDIRPSSRLASEKKNTTGVFMGQKVNVKSSPQSLLADAAEELTLTFNFSDKFAREKRKEKQSFDRIDPKRARLYRDSMAQMGKAEQLETLRNDLLSRENANAEWCLQQSTKYFEDSTDAWTALFGLKESLEQGLIASKDKDLQDNVRLAMQNLEERQGEAIAAGLMGATEARAEGERFAPLGEPTVLRDFYRNVLCDFENAEGVFKVMKERWTALDFEKGLDFLFHVLSIDLASDLPSMGKAHLENTLTNLGKVRLLQSAYVLFSAVLERWKTVHKQGNSQLQAMDLLDDMLHLASERYLGTMHTDSIVQKAKAPTIELEVLFTQDLLGAVRKTPAQLYGGDEGLSKIVETFQTSLDCAIEREDDYLASLEAGE